jgi:carbamoyl-phosphate synthase small subunit
MGDRPHEAVVDLLKGHPPSAIKWRRMAASEASMNCILLLEDGTLYEGKRIGAAGTALGQVVFSTAMTGYQEMLTDPSYAGQLLTLTYPLIGNYGVANEDFESHRVQVAGFIIRQLCDAPSHWRSTAAPSAASEGSYTLDSFLREHGVVGIQGIDTRALTRRIRVNGVMTGIVTSELGREGARERLSVAPAYDAIDFARRVTTPEPYVWKASGEGEPARRVVVVDCGVKWNILRMLGRIGCETTVVPCTYSAAQILELDPDGVAFSPGPGDPALLGYAVETARALVGKKPIFGICLGNQIVGCAFGATTFKLPFGHRGGNHPVKDLRTGRVAITSQNHGYAIDPEGLKGSGLEVTHVNLNDGTVEGLRHRELPIFTIQYHPEASPGPQDSGHLFDEFLRAM